MADYGEIQLGRLLIRENRAVGLGVQETGEGTLTINGQESRTRLSDNELKRRVDDIIGLNGMFLQATFTQKPELNAYYKVESVAASYQSWPDQATGNLPWSISLIRVGYETELEIESRLSGPITRSNNFAATGERWLVPPLGHTSLVAGTSVPSIAIRVGDEGTLVLYRSLPANVNPRYACPVAGYQGARVRLKDANGIERVSERFKTSGTNWEVSNSLLKVTAPAAGTIRTSAYISGNYWQKDWLIQGGATLGQWDGMSVLANTPEMVIIRLHRFENDFCKWTLDLTVRRGAYHVECFLQRSYAGTLAVKLASNEAATQTSGYLYATNPDAFNLRFLMGSAKTFTADVVNAKMSVAASLSMDFFLTLTPSAPGAGNTAANIYSQYLGTPYETVRGVRR